MLIPARGDKVVSFDNRLTRNFGQVFRGFLSITWQCVQARTYRRPAHIDVH